MSKEKTEPSVGSELVRRLEKFADALAESKTIGKRFTVRTLKLQLLPHQYGPADVKQTRDLLQASQAIFAQFVGVSRSAVRDWEQGIKPPSGAACRIMDEIRHNPAYFLDRLRKLSSNAKPAEPGT